jgi:membrane-associated phospholipid phosphatase
VKKERTLCPIWFVFACAVFSHVALCQQSSSIELPSARKSLLKSQGTALAPNFRVGDFEFKTITAEAVEPEDKTPISDSGSSQQEGLVKRSFVRIGEDQKRIYLAPFKRKNWKWDAITLVGAAAFLATDRRIENQVSTANLQTYQNISDIGIGGLAASLGGIWLYGIKTEHRHARETGVLELETLVNTFLVYTPMQLIFARQRPGEGNGHGDFFKHHSINTSFPGGHAMFTWAMASVLADEYPKPWARVLSYGAAFTVTFSRFMARDHWASDMFVGTALGLGIAETTFHSRCDPQFDSQSLHHRRWWKVLRLQVQ